VNTVTLRIEGGKQLEDNLRALGRAVSGEALEAGAKAAAGQVGAEMAHRMRRLTGRTAESITTEVTKRSSQRVEVVVGPSKERAFVARFLEYGTSRMPARPWGRPAFMSKAERALGELAAAVRGVIASATRGMGR
jgi:HK97 gp10 family phage protein